MKNTTLLLLILAWATLARGQGYNEREKQNPDCLPCRYDLIGAFSNGFATVVSNNKFGAINRYLKEVVPCIYDNKIDFDKHGLAFALKDSQYGIIDTMGNVMVPFIFEEVKSKFCSKVYYAFKVEDGLIVKVNGKYGILKEKGKFAIPAIYDYLDCKLYGHYATKYNGGIGVINENGKVVIPFKYCGIGDYFSDGYICVLGSNGKWGMADTSGIEVLPCTFKKEELDAINSFRRRLLLVGSPVADTNSKHYDIVFHDTTKTGVLARVKMGRYWGVRNSEGRQIAPPVYDTIAPYIGGFAKAKLDDKWGYINEQGRSIFPFKYSKVSDIYKGVVAVGGYYWGLVDTNNNVIIPEKYDKIFPFINDTACVILKDKVGFIDITGKEIVPCTFLYSGYFWELVSKGKFPQVPTYTWLKMNLDETGKHLKFTDPKGIYKRVHAFANGMAPIEDIEGNWGMIDKQGKVVIPCIYQLVGYCTEGRILVTKNDKSGFLNKDGKVAIPLTFDNALSFNEGLALVTVNGKHGFIDTNGKIVIPCKYHKAYWFTEGLAPVSDSTKWGYINKQGKLVIPFKYDFAWEFSQGLAAANADRKWGYINKAGIWVIPPMYEYVYNFVGGVATVSNNRKWGLINKKGELIAPIICDFVVAAIDSYVTMRIDSQFKNFYVNIYKLLNADGKEIKPDPNSWKVFPLGEGLFNAISYTGTSAIIDRNGKLIKEIGRGVVYEFSDGVAVIQSNGMWGYIDKTGGDIFWLGKFEESGDED